MTLEICRICGSNENLKHIFREGSAELVDQIRLCANIQIDELDCLPKFVCNVCEQGLAFSYSLRKRGEETEKKLRREMLTSTTENESYSMKEEIQREDSSEYLIEESCDEQLWAKDDDNMQFNDHDDLILKVEETDEDAQQVITEEPFDETGNWITLQNVEFSENIEIIEDAVIEKVEMGVVELIYDNNEAMPAIDQTESQTNKSPKKMQIECETCGEVFETRSKYCDHIKSHGDKRFYCVVCDKWFNVRYRYDQHIKNHSSERGAFPCPKCNKSYTIQCNLERHIRSAHNGEKRFQCAECGVSFGRPDILKMHRAKHSNERNVECDICQKKFKTSQHLHYHKKSHLQKSERPKKSVRLRPKAKAKVQTFVCDFCDKISHHRTTHLNHLRTHTGEKPFQCSQCDKVFRTTHARSNHMLLHTDQRPHQCKLCGMSFRQTAHLKSHTLIHTGVKRHVCDFCQKAFTMKSNLMVHLRMHTGEMPYKCNKCPQKFLQLGQVKRHSMNHMHKDELRTETCDENADEVQGEFNDSQISLYIDDIIEINQDNDSVVMSDCVVEEC